MGKNGKVKPKYFNLDAGNVENVNEIESTQFKNNQSLLQPEINVKRLKSD